MPSDASAPRGGARSVAVNGLVLRLPGQPVVVVCADGCDPAYLAAARDAGAIPALDGMMRRGFSATALAAMPTFTYPNNVSIVCGAPPAVHGVSGNYYLDRETGDEIMMLDARLLRAPTIPAQPRGNTKKNKGAKAPTPVDAGNKSILKSGIDFLKSKI